MGKHSNVKGLRYFSIAMHYIIFGIMAMDIVSFRTDSVIMKSIVVFAIVVLLMPLSYHVGNFVYYNLLRKFS